MSQANDSPEAATSDRKDPATPIAMPASLDACHALIEQLASTVDEQSSTIETLRQEKEQIQAEFALWVQRVFARRSERYINDPNQLKLDFGADGHAADAAEGLAQAVAEAGIVVQSHVRRPRQRRNESLPEHLERYEVEADVPEDVKHCPAHGPRQLIGYDTTEKLEYLPPKLRVRVTKYPKYACPQEPKRGVTSPERPTGLVEGDRYDSGVAAEIITAKYGYHLPLYRQQDLFAGSGWTPARSTLLNILMGASFVIEPLVAYFQRAVLADGVIGTDDTRVTLIVPGTVPKPDPKDPKARRAYEVLSRAVEEQRPSVNAHLWAYRGITVPLNVFDFTVSWHRDGPEIMLADYEGIVLGDCYSGYEGIALASDGRIRRASCAAHARRKFIEAKTAYPRESAVVLAKFRQLYDIEDQAKSACGGSPAARLELRQAMALPVWAELAEWLDSKAATGALPKSLLAKAVGYLRNQWDGLQTYLTDGRVPIDNNDVEQLMKQVALGRKNWMFVGSVEAGQRAADFLTLVSSAVRVEGQWHQERPGGAALQSDLNLDLIRLRQRHVLDQQAYHSFAILVAGMRIMPEPRQVTGQRQHLLPAGLIQTHLIFLSLLLVLFFSGSQGPELIIPISLQGGGDQPIVGIHLHEAVAGDVHLIPGPLYLLPPQSPDLLQPGLQFGLHGKGKLQRNWLHQLQQQFTHGLVDSGPGNLLADRLPTFGTSLLAHVIRHQGRRPGVIPHGHAPAADPADHQPLQQGWTLSGRAVPAILPMSATTGVQHLQMILVLLPSDVPGMGVGDEGLPLLLRLGLVAASAGG